MRLNGVWLSAAAPSSVLPANVHLPCILKGAHLVVHMLFSCSAFSELGLAESRRHREMFLAHKARQADG
jgi:hypothetical protein